MTVHRRWVCSACDREWVYSTTGNDACPICHCTEIERVEYLPKYSGADYHSPPELVFVDAAHPLPPVVERPNFHRDRNEALMQLDPYAEQLSALLGVEL
jgi:hypothetical protein